MSGLRSPAPWRLDPVPGPDGDRLIVTADGLATIAEVHDHSRYAADWPDGRAAANARLIAAAPALLTALEDLLGDAEGYARTCTDPAARVRVLRRADAARAAIAEAVECTRAAGDVA